MYETQYDEVCEINLNKITQNYLKPENYTTNTRFTFILKKHDSLHSHKALSYLHRPKTCAISIQI